MFKKIIYPCLLLFTSSLVYGQEEDWMTKLASAEFKARKVIPPTPEAASLGKYGNVPLSLFSGTPSISVPIYQLAGNSLSLPIQLTYNAGGFNPQEIAGWVGLNWSLDAGGVVTRSVMGNPDYYDTYFISPSPLIIPSQTSDPYGYYDHMENLRKGYKEAQPDMYYYNFAGHSGKFLVNPDNSIIKKEKNNYLITASAVGWPTGSNIVIIDEQGVRYEFMEYETSVMTPDDISTDVPIRTYTYPSTWYLTRIQSADGFEEITFTYYTTSLDHNQFNNFYQTESAVYQETISYTGGWSGMVGPEIKAYQPATVKTKRKYLQQIVFKRAGTTIAYIDFESSVDQRQDLTHDVNSGFPGERLLNSIKVYTKKVGSTFGLTKQFNLSYSYFTNSGNSGWDHKRLRLDNVQEIPVVGGTSIPPPYSFTYNNDNLMPGLNSTDMDHWGFYNIPNGNGSLVPTNYTSNGNIIITGTNRLPSLAGSSSYTINKVTYPTGGYTAFEYELNSASSYGNVGGIRIKKITDYSFNNKVAQQKTYEYSSGGVVAPQYLSSSVYQQLGNSGGWYDVCIDELLSQKTTYTISANSIMGLGVYGGSHIGYTSVTEYINDPSNSQPLGKTVYEYSITSLGAHDSYGNGNLIKKSVYDNGNKLIQEVTNTYNYVLNGSIGAIVPGVNGAQNNRSTLVKKNNPSGGYIYEWHMHPSCTNGVIESRIYKTKFVNSGWAISSRENQLTQQVVKQYDQLSNSYLTITRNFTYGNTAHTLPTKIDQTTSNNEVLVTEKKYPLDYTIPGGALDNNTTGIKLQKDKNIIGAEVESIQYRQNPDGSNKRYLSGTITNYDPYIPYPKQLLRLELSSPLTSFTMSATSGGVFSYNSNYKPLGSFTFQSNGALLQQSKDLDVATAFVWDHDYQYPTAEAANAQIGQIAYSSFETDGAGEWTTIPNITTYRVSGGVTGKYSYNLTTGNDITKTNLSTALVYKVSYWSMSGSVSVTSNAGSTTAIAGSTHGSWTYYEHLLPANTSSITVSASGKVIDELRLYPNNAFMTTVAYDPGVGTISVNSPNNKIGYFEYDGLNRLINAKDEDANIIKNYKYNFGTDLSSVTASTQSLFYNVQTQATYTKQGCTNGGEGTAVTYIVPYGRYAALDQTTANNKAEADKTANGQAYANAYGQCLYWNQQQSGWFTKNDCAYEQGPPTPSQIQYTYSSLIDLTTANNLAIAAVQAGGQAYANSNCSCSCTAEGYKYINGNCELGTRYNSSTTYIGGGIWECTYYYEWSDYSVSQFYTEYNSYPCPIY
jgi:hypothetical protein